MSDADDHNPSPPAAEPVERRYKLVIAYDGTLFHGWQKQHPPGSEPLRTVQGVVEEVIARTVGQPVNLVGASRTDAGVHARGQVAQFDAACRIPVERLAEALNSRLPDDVQVLHAQYAPPGFEAISGAVSKQYRYRLFNSPLRPLEKRHYVYHCWHELDLAKMNDAAARLVGTHDFEGFSAAKHGRLSTVRTIFACEVVPHQEDAEVHVVISGNGFLYNMVRIIAGTLVEVGRGKMPPSVIDEVLASKDRRLAGVTLPPTGLWLEWIRY